MPQGRSRPPRPTLEESTRARLVWAAPTKPRRPPGPWRSGCSRRGPTAFVLPPCAARDVGRAPFHLTREGQRRASHLLETPAPLDTHVDVHTARARGLGPAAQPVLVENVAHEQGHSPHKVPADTRAGV